MQKNKMLKIEKGVKLPEKKNGVYKKYPFDEMKPGDSFWVAVTNSQTTRTSVWAYQKAHPEYQFQTRSVEGGLRVWRVK